MKNNGEHCRLLEHLFVGFRIKKIKEFASDTGLFDSISEKNKKYTTSFLGKNCVNLDSYRPFLYLPEIFLLAQLSANLHKSDKRKATGDPYFKHLFYTSYLCHEITKQDNYDDGQKRIFIGAAFFHDALEMKKKGDPTYDRNDILLQMTDEGISHDEAQKIFTMINILTPPQKKQDMEIQEWIKRKRADFDYIMQIDGEQVNQKYSQLFKEYSLSPLSREEADKIAEMIKQIKIADDVAIVRETVDDVKCKRDDKHETRNGMRPLSERVKAYQYRLDKIKELYSQDSSVSPLITQMEKDMAFLSLI